MSPARPPARRLASVAWTFAALAIACSGVVVAVSDVGGVAADEPPAAVALTTGVDGEIVWASDNSIQLESGPVLEVGWDLRGLDPARYRSDLVQFRLDSVDGPGRFVAATASPFGDDEVLADSSIGAHEFVLQVGRNGAMRWSFDQPGAYRLAFNATIPAAGGAIASAAATYDITVTDAPAAPVAGDTSASPLAARAEALAALPRAVTSDEVTYTVAVGDVGNAGGRLVLDVGHVDAIAPTLTDGELVIQAKDDSRLHDSGIVYRNPQDVILQVLPAAEMPIPAAPSFEFLGTAGDPVWMLPMAQDSALLWPGWSTEHTSLAGEFTSLDFEITDVRGPGEFHLFLTDTFGNPIHRANSLGNLPNTWSERVPAHVHANWVFTQHGTYEITVQASGSWLNAPDPQDAAATSTTTPTGGTGSSTTSTTSAGGGSGSSTTSTAAGAGRGGGNGRPLANTGAAHLGATVALALACLAVGSVLLRVRRHGRAVAAPES